MVQKQISIPAYRQLSTFCILQGRSPFLQREGRFYPLAAFVQNAGAVTGYRVGEILKGYYYD